MQENEWEDLRIAADKVRLLGGTPDVRLFLKAVAYVEDLMEDLAQAEQDALSWESSYMRQINRSEELEYEVDKLEREKALLESNIEDLETAL